MTARKVKDELRTEWEEEVQEDLEELIAIEADLWGDDEYE